MNAKAVAPVSRVIALAGTAGGVGTTTVAALLFSGFGQPGPRLLDRSGGELGRRLTGGDDVAELSDELTLHDLGPHAAGRALDRLDDRRNLLIVVTAATPRGIAESEAVLGSVRERFGQPGLVRTIVTPVGVFGRSRVAREVALIQEQFGRRGVVPFPRDPVLAGGGRIPANRLSVETRRAQGRLVHAVRERLRTLT